AGLDSPRSCCGSTRHRRLRLIYGLVADPERPSPPRYATPPRPCPSRRSPPRRPTPAVASASGGALGFLAAGRAVVGLERHRQPPQGDQTQPLTRRRPVASSRSAASTSPSPSARVGRTPPHQQGVVGPTIDQVS